MVKDVEIDKKRLISKFQTFYVSKEKSHSVLIPDIIKLGKKIKELGFLKDNTVTISIGYGKRMLINSIYAKISEIKPEDIIEVVDYDPVKKIALIIGKKIPDDKTPVHWIIQHARDDINITIQIIGEEITERLSKVLPSIEEEQPSGTIEQAKEILKTLRTSKNKNIILKNKGVLFTAHNLKEVEDLIIKASQEIK
jgi:ribulose-5-phosphate 4-epimerase/fuculose-1-phosphate aldolase